MRRNKQEMACMRTLVEMYLNDNQNNPQLAYNEYIKWYLTNNVKLPHHVNGIRDFIKVASENKSRYEHTCKLEERSQEEAKEKEQVKDKIPQITMAQAKDAWNNVKINGTDKDKMTICDLYQHVASGMIDLWKYNCNDIHVLKKFNLI